MLSSGIPKFSYLNILPHIKLWFIKTDFSFKWNVKQWEMVLLPLSTIINFAQWRYTNQWSIREVVLLLVENYSQYPGRTTWNIVVRTNFWQLSMEATYIKIIKQPFYFPHPNVYHIIRSGHCLDPSQIFVLIIMLKKIFMTFAHSFG